MHFKKLNFNVLGICYKFIYIFNVNEKKSFFIHFDAHSPFVRNFGLVCMWFLHEFLILVC